MLVSPSANAATACQMEMFFIFQTTFTKTEKLKQSFFPLDCDLFHLMQD
jgi:hypothetical protein